MKVKILRNTAASGRMLSAGTIEDVGADDAKALILIGKALPVGAAPAPVDNREKDILVDTRSSKSKPKKKPIRKRK